MPESEPSLLALYEWTCRVEDELEDLKGSFPESFQTDRSRLVMSLTCLGVGLELALRLPRRTGRPAPNKSVLPPRPLPRTPN